MTAYGNSYARIYDGICGRAPHERPWHFRWLPVFGLYKALKETLPLLEGRVLDVGCGSKPYGPWMKSAAQHVGLDVFPGPTVDVVIQPEETWPIAAGSFDGVLCTQVLEHVADLPQVLGEISRVIKPGGRLVVTVPFAYNEHRAPHDHRRLSIHGLRWLFEKEYEIEILRPIGGIGSTMGTFFLNWIDLSLSRRRWTRVLKAVLLPLWILISTLVNTFSWLIDKLDRTGAFYNNTILVATKRGGPTKAGAVSEDRA
jgi:SAM-dependent methyltransferase